MDSGKLLNVNTDFPATITIYIEAATDSAVKTYKRIIYVICGNEQVTLTLDDGDPLTPAPVVYFYHQYRTGTNLVQTSHADVLTWFNEPEDGCTFTNYELLISSAGKYYPSPFPNVKLDSKRALLVTTDRNMKETIYVQVTTRGKVK